MTLAGLLLIGTNPQKYKPLFSIKCISFFGNDISGRQFRDKEDLFEGKSQQKIAINICNIITTEKSCNIIGIDGGWGSGKSNLVRQVQNVLSKNNYHFFIYDA